jgi:hypothetical protein
MKNENNQINETWMDIQAQHLAALPLLKLTITRIVNYYRHTAAMGAASLSPEEVRRRIFDMDSVVNGLGIDTYQSDDEWREEGQRWQSAIREAFPEE